MNPILGRNFTDPPMEIRNLTTKSGLVTIQGKVSHFEKRKLKGGEVLLLSFIVSDNSSYILCKAFIRYKSRYQSSTVKEKNGESILSIAEEERKNILNKIDQIRKSGCVIIRGECMFDNTNQRLTVVIRDLMKTKE